MKPSFALDFRDGLVTLLHRTSRGWSQVGSTTFDAPDFAEALGYMRSTALGLSPRGITTKLVIPHEQILYTAIHAPGPDAAKRKRQIRTGLEGLTPYAIDDLVYDWSGTGPDLNVAVVARETLAEAEAFAAEHRFNPVSFVGVPEDDAFQSEPFFGPTSLAATLLAEGEKVERDQDPIAIIARDFPRSEPKAKVAEPDTRVADAQPADIAQAPAATAPKAALPEPETGVATEGAPKAIQDVIPQAAKDMAAKVAAQTIDDVAPRAEPLSAPAMPARVQAPPPPVAEPKPAADFVAPKADINAEPRPEPKPESLAPKIASPRAETSTPSSPVLTPTKVDPGKAAVPEAPMAMDVAAESGLSYDDDVPPSPAAEIVAAFASRRTAAIAAATAKQAGTAAPKIPSVGPAPAQRPTVPRPNVARPAPTSPRDTVPFPTAKAGTPPAKPVAGKPAKTGGASVTANAIMGARRERNVVALPTAGTPEEQAAAAARRASVKPPTGLGSRTAPIKGKPRYLGLILTVLLLVLLVAVAAWSSFFMGANDTTGTGAGTPTATSPSASLTPPDAALSNPDAVLPEKTASLDASPSTAATAALPAGDATATSVVPQATADAANPAALPVATDSGTTATTTPAAPVAADQTATAAQVAPTTDAGAASVPAPAATEASGSQPTAVTGSQTATATGTSPAPTTPPAGQVAALTPAQPVLEPAPKTEVATLNAPVVPPDTAVQDKIVVALADTPPKAIGPLALPAVAAGADASPAAEPMPPPYGTVYKFDADGRIIPTPEGIITPEGVMLIAGKPKPVPPARPAGLAPAAPLVSVSVAPADAAAGATAAAAPDAALALPGTATPAATISGTGTSIAAAPTAAAPTPDTMTPAATTPSDPAVTAADGTAATATTPALPAAAAPVTDAAAAPLAQDPTLAHKHPKTKPANLAPAPDQQGAAASPQDSRLAGLHPEARPADLPSPLAADTGADATAASASLAANGFALATSPIPPRRPSGLDRAVDTAVATALQDPAPDTQVVTPDTQVASNDTAAPEAQAEPDTEAPAPDLPINASVAKQATTKHALKTNQMALLAVFGTPSTRFAMIRQGNGAVKKIGVGDTVDGGRVAAITENSVQYQKGGRIVTLSLPSG